MQTFIGSFIRARKFPRFRDFRAWTAYAGERIAPLFSVTIPCRGAACKRKMPFGERKNGVRRRFSRDGQVCWSDFGVRGGDFRPVAPDPRRNEREEAAAEERGDGADRFVFHAKGSVVSGLVGRGWCEVGCFMSFFLFFLFFLFLFVLFVGIIIVFAVVFFDLIRRFRRQFLEFGAFSYQRETQPEPVEPVVG